jgi:hypothetical protein
VLHRKTYGVKASIYIKATYVKETSRKAFAEIYSMKEAIKG